MSCLLFSRCRVRIAYNWRDLWSTLIALLKFVVANESNLNKKINVFNICSQVLISLEICAIQHDDSRL